MQSTKISPQFRPVSGRLLQVYHYAFEMIVQVFCLLPVVIIKTLPTNKRNTNLHIVAQQLMVAKVSAALFTMCDTDNNLNIKLDWFVCCCTWTAQIIYVTSIKMVCDYSFFGIPIALFRIAPTVAAYKIFKAHKIAFARIDSMSQSYLWHHFCMRQAHPTLATWCTIAIFTQLCSHDHKKICGQNRFDGWK